MPAVLTLDRLNAASRDEFTALLDGIYEHSPWIARAGRWRAAVHEPRRTEARAGRGRARQPARETQLALVRAHPELAGKAMVSKSLTAESTNEQGRAGLTDCTPEEFATIQQLNADYNAKFGLPFILAVRGPRGTGLTRQRDHRRPSSAGWPTTPTSSSPSACATSTASPRSASTTSSASTPALGNLVWDWAEALGRAQRPGLRRAGPAHRHLPDRRAPRLRGAARRPGCARMRLRRGVDRRGRQRRRRLPRQRPPARSAC